MYILHQGDVNVITGDEDFVTTVLHESQVFGERALDQDGIRTASIVARSNKVICLSLSKKEYKEILYVRYFNDSLISMYKCFKGQKDKLFYRASHFSNSGFSLSWSTSTKN